MWMEDKVLLADIRSHPVWHILVGSIWSYSVVKSFYSKYYESGQTSKWTVTWLFGLRHTTLGGCFYLFCVGLFVFVLFTAFSWFPLWVLIGCCRGISVPLNDSAGSGQWIRQLRPWLKSVTYWWSDPSPAFLFLFCFVFCFSITMPNIQQPEGTFRWTTCIYQRIIEYLSVLSGDAAFCEF